MRTLIALPLRGVLEAMYKGIGITAFSVVMLTVAFIGASTVGQVGLDHPWIPFVFALSGTA